MSKTIIIAGRGPSAYTFDWPDGVPVMAVSGGFDPVQRLDHFVTVDKALCFPTWVTGGDRFQKHVLQRWRREPGDEWEECTIWPAWSSLPNVRGWDYEESATEPNFTRAGPISKGLLNRNNSMLFAVQLATRLGFDHLIFIGCDFTDPDLYPIASLLKEWHPRALANGITWENASEISLLQEWIPGAGVCPALSRPSLRLQAQPPRAPDITRSVAQSREQYTPQPM